MTSTPNLITLSVLDEFKASHSLTGFETPHFHLWKVTAEFQANVPLAQDRVIDIIFVQELLHKIKAPLQGKFLNDALGFSPTSENISQYFWTKLSELLPDAPLVAVSISLCDLDGRVSGVARLSK